MNTKLFHEIYQICTDAHDGAFIPQAAAQLIAERTGLPVAAVLQELTTPAVYLYEDTLPALDAVFARPNVTPILWTEGELSTAAGESGYQIHKVEAAQLLIRYPQWTERAAALDLSPVIGGFTKREALAPLRTVLARHAIGGVTLVDDKPEQLADAGAILTDFVAQVQPTTEIRLFHIDRSDAPDQSHLPTIQRLVILRGLPSHLPTDRPHLLLLDLDYTLIDHALTRQEMAERMGRLIEQAG